MSPDKVKKLKSIFTANGGCGCDSTAATDIIQPKPKSIIFSDQNLFAVAVCPSSPDSSWMKFGSRNSAVDDDEDCTSTTFSINSPGHCCTPEHQHQDAKTIIRSYGKIEGSSAVIKDSDDPYRDFRHSMVEMILENRIYSRNDLQQLLDCFLQLNSARHHETIIRAFMEIWNGGIGAGSGG